MGQNYLLVFLMLCKQYQIIYQSLFHLHPNSQTLWVALFLIITSLVSFSSFPCCSEFPRNVCTGAFSAPGIGKAVLSQPRGMLSAPRTVAPKASLLLRVHLTDEQYLWRSLSTHSSSLPILLLFEINYFNFFNFSEQARWVYISVICEADKPGLTGPLTSLRSDHHSALGFREQA